MISMKAILGVGLILFGCYTAYDSYTYKPRNAMSQKFNIGGYTGAIIAFFIGIMLILGKW